MPGPLFTRMFVEEDIERAVNLLNRTYYDLVELEKRLAAETAKMRGCICSRLAPHPFPRSKLN